jgi:uncharacterized protein (TIGR02588 family)
MNAPSPDAKDSARPPEGSVTSRWGWVIAVVGLVLVLATVGYLVRDAVFGSKTAPAPVASVKSVQSQGGRFLVEVQVHNAGHSTAAGLRLVGRLRQGATVVEEAETAFDYLPAGSTRRAGLFFAHDPAGYQLELGAESYQEP